MQFQDLLSAAQGGTFRVTKLFLKENPDILQRYVDVGMNVVGLVLTPLNVFMKHLLVVQGIDPNTVPGEKARRALQEAMDASITEYHEKEYDADYDFSLLHKKFEETRNQLAALGLTKEKYRTLTDLAKLPGGFKNPNNPAFIDRYPTINTEDDFFDHTTELNRVAPESEKKELPLDTKEGRAAYREKVVREAADALKSETKKVIETFDPIDSLREAVASIEKELKLKQKETKKPTGIKTGKKKANKKTSFATPSTRMTVKKKDSNIDPKFKGNFWRAANEEMK